MKGTPSNKGMKLTSVERIGRSQLIPGVRRTFRGLAMRALMLVLAIAVQVAPAGEQPSACEVADCLKRIKALVPIEAVASPAAALAGTWSSGGGLSGSVLYLFDDRTYVFTEWADIMAETVVHKGSWQVADTVVLLAQDPDVTWSVPGDRRYLVYRSAPSKPVRLLGLDLRLGILERVTHDIRGRNALALKVASLSRNRTWLTGESARRKAEVMEKCWHPDYWLREK